MNANQIDDKNSYGNMIKGLVTKAHNLALGAESRCFGLGGAPSNDIIPFQINEKYGTFVVREVGGKMYVMPFAKYK